jgi:GT2 family glycosyltransferase
MIWKRLEKNKMRCTLVMLNYNESEKAIDFISKWHNFFYRIVLVDNDSETKQKMAIESFGKHFDNIKIIENGTNCGYACGNNIGLIYAVNNYQQDCICCINPDIELDLNLLEACSNFLIENLRYGVISTRFYEIDGSEGMAAWHFPNIFHQIKMMGYFYKKKHDFNIGYNYTGEKEVIDVDAVRGSLMFFNPTVLRKIGFFDEKTFLYNEENIICTKIRQAGFLCGLLTDRFYIHNHYHPQKSLVNINLFKFNIQSTFYYFYNYTKSSKFALSILYLTGKVAVFNQIIINKLKMIKNKDKVNKYE